MDEHLWVYGVVGGEAPVPAQLGVDPNYRVLLVRAAGLGALASPVGYDDHTLRAALQDRAAFETLSRSHERVLGAALTRGPVVPFRVGAVFASEAGVRDLLAQAQSAFLTALRRLRGRAEWGVTIYAIHPVAASVVTPASAEIHHDGLGFATHNGDERRHSEVERFLLLAHARLTGHASDVLVSPGPEPPARPDADVVLDARYLIPDEHAAAFGAEAAQLGRAATAHGLQLELTGPWPAYHFSALEA